MLQVKLKKVRESAKVPDYATQGAAAMDLCACLENEPSLTLQPGERKIVPSGIAIALPDRNSVAILCARSGLACKNGICLANGIGVIDSDYRGEIGVALLNTSDTPYTVHNGDRIAQLMFLPVLTAQILVTAALEETERGEGGFGSTGKQ